jgi:Mn2+/Fe2+ NRAMP family transporter
MDIMGPGLITGASDDDPSGIATYSQAGAQFGYNLGWTLLLSVLKWLTVSLFAYVVTVFAVGVPWPEVARHLLLPSIELKGDYLTVVVAILGTTISPYLFFWQAGQEVEDEKESATAKPLNEAPEQAPQAMRRMRLDTFVGMGLSNLVALFIMLTTAATLHAYGHTDIQTSSQAAEALRPIAGRFAFTIFAPGIIGTGLLALPVLVGSAAYAVGEALRWPVGLAREPGRAKAFYGTIAVATVIGGLMNFSSLDPVKALFWSAVVNVVVAVPVMMMMLLASREDVMGKFVLGRWLNGVGWLSTAVILLAAIGMFATWNN